MSDALAENDDPTPTSGMAPKERELLSAILDVASALIVVLDRDGRIVLFNKACERATGYRFMDDPLVVQAKQAGALSVLSKPFNNQDLMCGILQAIGPFGESSPP